MFLLRVEQGEGYVPPAVFSLKKLIVFFAHTTVFQIKTQVRRRGTQSSHLGNTFPGVRFQLTNLAMKLEIRKNPKVNRRKA